VAHFTDADQFLADVDGLFDRLKHVKPAPGFQRVMIPGEPEAEQRLKRTGAEIGVHSAIWERIVQIAAESQINLTNEF
jgi:ureidoglycolate dehydrogenase (NAD+)